MDKCNAKTMLKISRIKYTRQRQIVLDRIINLETVFSADSLFQALAGEMDLVTIYRTLAVFKEKKIIREIVSSDDIKYYELACVHHPVHPHYFCKTCKQLYCLEELTGKDLEKLKVYLGGLAMEEISVQFSGTCRKCQ